MGVRNLYKNYDKKPHNRLISPIQQKHPDGITTGMLMIRFAA
jgi:hypothetical protein